ncbi:dNA gyrase B subunit C-terminal domain protein [Coprococcus sp. CAG:782]|jgi:DNA gyrase subunit B|uniref:DNA gyrase/topoisomerase IV subunit B n=1 Tax=Coprococcus sp. OM04-5BH TaxID=2293093 RepID=UPI00033863A3|nr:DNA gyrase subunit B [Coprococcus sp. OM04-5BH]MEE0035742.1 DNA gyrase subunit B [Coprococcus sp.]RHV34113.1 DNA gyrase subunit B [Coprococcus sp. OM04-5BH]CCY53921.1 dNA gyrase B subunit C-terminal domain protein [Coprococcus sp. CAG:782]
MSYSAKNIEVLKGLEPVRLRPGMYIGNTGRSGLNHLVQELIDNSVDEHLAGYCKNIYVSINEDGSATVSDDGRGVPVDIHATEGIPAERVVYTVLHAGGKFNGNTYKISGGLHGVGSAVVNALSKKLIVDVARDGYLYHDSYEYGNPTTELIDGNLPKEKLKTRRTGTTVTLYPDESIFETVKFKADAIRQRIKETCYLNPELTITFENKRDGKEPIVFHQPGGLSAFVEDISEGLTRTSPVVAISGEKDGISADIVFLMTEDGEENIIGFTNNITNPEGGTHVTGFKTGFAKLINNYARNELGLLKDKDSNLSGADIRSGMQAIISVKHPDPQFEGQTKTKLSNTDVTKAVDDIVKEQLTVYFDRNYEVLKDICDRAVALSKKKAMDKSKINISKFSFEGNGKLAKQESNDAEKCEIFIVEGDSAGGSAKTARNRKYQAILPLRGKILNVEKKPVAKVLENAEIKALINAFGCGFLQGYGNDFDISKLNYNKIIIMTDADVDGAHIATLLLTFFYRFFPDLIREGHIYIAIPPLYRVGEGKNIKYLYSDDELAKYRKTHQNKFMIQRYKGLGEMDADQLYETTMDPDNRVLKQVSINSIVEANQLTQTLMGTEVAPRREYIETHSMDAVLDI